MSSLTMDHSFVWPKVALDFGVVTRGDLIRRARDLRRESRAELAKRTGVGARTITRIENGNVSDRARSVAILEEALAPEIASITASTTAPTRADVTLGEANDLDVFTELARRISDSRRRIAELEAELRRATDPDTARADEPAPAPAVGRRVRYTRDAPSAKRGNGEPNTGTDAALGDG